MAVDGKAKVKEYKRFLSDRSNHDYRWEKMAPYLAPSRMGILGPRSDGEKQSGGVYDSTMMMAAEQMAMFIAGSIISPAQRWVDFSMQTQAYSKHGNDELREWTEECRDRTLKNLSASSFYSEGPESLIDWGGFGTGFMIGEEAPQPVNRTIRGFRGFYWNASKTGRFVIADGVDGKVEKGYREFERTASVAETEFGKQNLPNSIVQALNGGQGDKKFKFIHGIYPRPLAEAGYGAKGMPWGSCWIELESSHVVKESGYQYNPMAVPRWQRTPSEVYGRGRGDIAFPDNWSLNTAKRMGFEDWALKIKPPIMMRHDSVMSALRLIPGGPTTFKTGASGRIQDVAMPWQTGSHPEVSQIKEEELRKSIREIFFVESIRQLLQVEKSEMTAFEFAKKLELLFQILGPVYGRLEWEWLYVIVDMAFSIQMQAGAFSPPPPEIEETDGVVSLKFQNPISRAQRASDSESLNLGMNDMAAYAQMHPEVLDWIDPDLTAQGILENRGFPAKWMRNEGEVGAIRKERTKQQQQQQSLDQLEQLGSAVGQGAKGLQVLQGGQGQKAA